MIWEMFKFGDFGATYIRGSAGQKHGWGWLGSLCHQATSSSSFGYIWRMGHCFFVKKNFNYLCNLSFQDMLETVSSWWRHQMETFSALLVICAGNSPVPGEFPTQRPVTRSFDVYFDLRPDKRLSKQSWGWWFETLSHSLWRHRNVHVSLHKFRMTSIKFSSAGPREKWQSLKKTLYWKTIIADRKRTKDIDGIFPFVS